MMEIRKKKYGMLRNMIYVFRGIRKYAKWIFYCVFLSALFSTATIILGTYMTKWILEGFLNSTELNVLLSTIIVLVLIEFVFKLLSSFFQSEIEHGLVYPKMRFMALITKKNMEMDYELLEDPNVLDQRNLAQRAVDNNDGIQGLMNLVSTTILAFMKMIVTTLVLSYLDIRLIIVAILLCLIQFIAFRRTIEIDKKISWVPLSPLWRRVHYIGRMTNDSKYAKDIRANDLTDFIDKKNKDINVRTNKLIAKSKHLWIVYGCLVNIVSGAINFSVYAYVVFMAYLGKINIAECTFYIANTLVFFQALNDFLYSLGDMSRCSMEVDEYRAYLGINNLRETASESVESIRTPYIEFKNVSFRYPNQERYALKDFSIRIPYGTKLAVVGLNGAGKTTFIKLLLRLYFPETGEVLIDGKNINLYDQKEYFSLFAPLFQNVNLYAMRFFENVSLKNRNDTDLDVVENCLQMVGLDKKVNTFADRLDTQVLKIIDEKGVDLSGGEKQKLALARALYKDSKIVVLDEPTSALDAIAEYDLYKKFSKMVKGKTAVFISHRLSSTKFCDIIALFENGCLAEYGTHTELLSKNGKYREMFDVQSNYYKEETINEEA